MEPELKRCSRCKESKLITDFGKSTNYCKPCTSEYDKTRYLKQKLEQEARLAALSKRLQKCKICKLDKWIELFDLYVDGKKRRKVCSDCFNEKQDRRPKSKLKPTESSKMVGRAKNRAKLRRIPFNISQSDVDSVWAKDGKCPICGDLMVKGARMSTPKSPSLDRIDAKLGYVVGNIAVICLRCNSCKQNESDPQVFINIAEWLKTVLKP